MRWGLTGVVFVVVATMTLSSCNDNGGPSEIPAPTPSPYDWTEQQSNTTVDLFDVFFINNYTGWAVGEKQVLLATTTGGNTWGHPPKQVGGDPPATEPIQRLNSIFFLDNATGYAVGGSDEIPFSGEVFMTTTSGAYPVLQSSSAAPFYSVFFLDRDNGWATGAQSTVHHTVNGGKNWTVSKIGNNIVIFDVQFLTPKMGWASTENGGIYRTKDGSTWEKEETGVIGPITSIQVIDTLNAWACGGSNAFLRRELDAANKPVWTNIEVTEFFPGGWSDLFFLDKQTGWIVGSGGKIFRTDNGGLTWRQETTITSNNLTAIHMINKTAGWAVGENGTMLTYTPKN